MDGSQGDKLKNDWTEAELEIAMMDLPLEAIADMLGGKRTIDSIRQHRFLMRQKGRIKPSPYPSYNQPPRIETDKILVIPDLELPFHNADFVNRIVDLALAWNIDTMLAAGDMFHLEVLTGWEPNWKSIISSYMDEDTKDMLIDLFNSLPMSKRDKGFEILEKCEPKEDDGFADEIRACKKVVKALDCFKNKWHIQGNHEGRLLKAMNSGLNGQNLADIFQMTDWHVSEYYFAEVVCKELFRIAHPKPYARNTPVDMASRFLCHYLMGHSHDLCARFDRSGKFWAIAMGHCADESKFPYEAQRDRMYWAHVPGAVIIRDGYPFLLCESTPWKLMEKM